jgi:membrane protein
LFGAELSFANQHVDNYEFEAETKHISPFNKKILALYILHLLVHHFQQGLKPVASDDISNILHIPNSLVRIILNELEDIEMVSQVDVSNSKRSAYQPALDINQITIKTVLEKLDHHGMDVLIAKPSPILDQLKEALSSFHRHIGASEQNKLLKDI